jgi:cell wall assembly regulator SMI1
MNEQSAGKILAVVTLQMSMIGGGAPIFFARDEEEQQKVANYLSRILDATAHDLENGSLILVKH